MSRLGDRLRELRGALSLLEVERGTGMSRSGICRYEQGVNVPHPENLKKLADYYEVPYKELRKLYLDDLYCDPTEREIVIEWANDVQGRG